MKFFLIIFGFALSETLAWWWMHPPQEKTNVALLQWNPALLGSSQQKTIEGKTDFEVSWHPELYENYQKSLNCSSGSVCQLKGQDGLDVHAALFGWDNSASGSANEAFLHRPEECLGSIGMKLAKEYQQRSYQVGSETLQFNHTLFHDPKSVPVHAFKATWITGQEQQSVSSLSQTKEWRELRTRAALSRFKPDHARVVQGAVRGVYNAEQAWVIFSQNVLHSLTLESKK